MKANVQPRVTADPSVVREFREHANLINLISDGRLTGTNNATTAAPTTGTHARGDYVRNSEPSEVGTAGNSHVVLGWVCTLGGTPGTWVEVRASTGGGLNFTKILEGTATLDFPSVGANGTAALSITVTGAEVGDYAIARPPAAFETGLVFSAFVSATDTVRVRIHNNSGGSVDPASGTWGALVLKAA